MYLLWAGLWRFKLFKGVLQKRKALEIELVVHPLSPFFSAHQVGRHQRLHVMGNGGLGKPGYRLEITGANSPFAPRTAASTGILVVL